MLKRLKAQGIRILVSTLLYGWGPTLSWSELPLIQGSWKIMSIDYTPRANISIVIPEPPFRSETSKMSVLPRRFTEARSGFKSCLLLGVSFNLLHSKEKFTGKSAIASESLGNAYRSYPWKLKEITPTLKNCFIQLMSHWYEKCSHQNG